MTPDQIKLNMSVMTPLGYRAEDLTALEMPEQTHYADWQKLTPLPDEPRPYENVRSHNVGSSDYAKHKIQPWDVWLDHHVNPWEGDIVKRVIRRKKGQNRKEDFEKIIHIAQELIRQIDAGEYVDYKLMAEENKELKNKIETLQNENKNNNC